MTRVKALILRAPTADEPELFIKWSEDHEDIIPLEWDNIVYLMAQCALIIRSWPRNEV